MADERLVEEREEGVDDRLDVLGEVHQDVDERRDVVDELIELNVRENVRDGLDERVKEEGSDGLHLLIDLGQSAGNTNGDAVAWLVEDDLGDQWLDGEDEVEERLNGGLEEVGNDRLQGLEQVAQVQGSLAKETADPSGKQVGGVVNDRFDSRVDNVVDNEAPERETSLAKETANPSGEQVGGVLDN